MGVETSNMKTEPLDPLNMVIAIGKRNEINNGLTMLVTTTSKLGLGFASFSSLTANSIESDKQKK